MIGRPEVGRLEGRVSSSFDRAELLPESDKMFHHFSPLRRDLQSEESNSGEEKEKRISNGAKVVRTSYITVRRDKIGQMQCFS